MNRKIRFLLLTSLTLLVMVVSALHLAIARADDSTPVAPTSPVADTSVAPVDTSVPVDSFVSPTPVIPANTSVPVDTSASSTSIAPANTPTTFPITSVSIDTTVTPTSTVAIPSATDVTTMLSQVPTGMPVVVLDTTGTAVPLAAQAADINTGDPIWCPTGKTPADGTTGGCTPSETSLTALVSDLTGSTYIKGGTVYIASNYVASTTADNGKDITFDYGNNYLTDLTVQGGWDFTLNTHTTGTISDLTGINSLNFIDWGGYSTPASLTINDITIDGGGSGPYGSTLYVGPANDTPSGDVALNNVSVTNSAGADIETGNGGSIKINKRNTSDKSNFSGNTGMNDGLYASAAGGFDADNVTASGNGGVGLFVLSTGDITINNVTADNNYYTGANLQNYLTSATSAVSISNSTFKNNGNSAGSSGLYVSSNGNITLESVTVDDNALTGHPYYGASLGSFINNIVIDKSEFNSNQNDGIYVRAAQSVSVTCSSANNNAGYGVDTTVSSLTLESVTLNSNSSGAYNASGTPTIGNIDCNPSSGGGNGHSSGNQSGSGSGSESGSTPSFITVPATSDVGNTLDCISYGGSNFVLPDGDLVILPCTSGGGQVTLNDVPSTSLPGNLDAKFTFLSGFSVTTTSPLTGAMTVAYPNLTGKDASHFAILRWNGSSWDDLGGTIDLPTPRHFGIETKLTGTFVLVTE